MVAPKSKLGYSHIIKKNGTLAGVINDDKLLYGMHIKPISISENSGFFAVKEEVVLLPEGGYDILVGTNELIYHINKDKSIFVATEYKVVGDEADTIRGAIFALSNLDVSTEDKISIAMKAIDCNNYEVVKV